MSTVAAGSAAESTGTGVGHMPFLALMARAAVGGLFIATGWAKVVNLKGFAEEIQNYQLAPIEITHAMAITISWLEILAGALLAFGLWRREARAWTVGVMLIAFTLLKAWAQYTGKAGDCGCGGSNWALKMLLENPQGIFVNLGLLGLLVFDGWSQLRGQSVTDQKKV